MDTDADIRTAGAAAAAAAVTTVASPSRRKSAAGPPTPAAPATHLKTAAPELPVIGTFPWLPPRDDMMNPRYLHAPGHQPSLCRHLGNPDTTIVLAEVPISRTFPLGRRGVRRPDLLIAFNVRPARILAQEGYAISEQGKPPDFVLEVASNTTSRRDETEKWHDYANFGITEYWLFDPDWGRRYTAGLIGWRLVRGRYRRIRIRRYGPHRYCGDSAVLGLQVCWEEGQLRWYDPIAGRYLDTFDSVSDERDSIAIERDAVAEERDAAARNLDAALAENRRLLEEIARLRAAGRE